MKFLDNYSYYYDNKKLKNDIRKEIQDILAKYTLNRVFDYSITQFIVDVYSNIIVDVSIFGFGKPNIDKPDKKEDPLIKLKFEKDDKTWKSSYKKSKLFRKIENRNTEIKMENINNIREEILFFLKNKKMSYY